MRPKRRSRKRNRPARAFRLSATHHERAFFFACPSDTGTQDNRVVPEHGSAAWVITPMQIWPQVICHLQFRGLGDTKPDVVVLIRRVVVVVVAGLQVVVVVVERPAPQPAIRTAISPRSPLPLLFWAVFPFVGPAALIAIHNSVRAPHAPPRLARWFSLPSNQFACSSLPKASV